MSKKIFIGAFFSTMMIIGVQAQEKKVKVSDGNIKTEARVQQNTIQLKEAPASNKELVHPEANVNFEENISNRTMGKDAIVKKTLNYEGLVVGENRSTIPITMEQAGSLQINFKAENPNALYYLMDRLENIIIPATEKDFNDVIPAGEFILGVGLMPEAAKKGEKSVYTFEVTK
ncbi:MAG: hypothetical protein Q4G27_03295 [Flavobacteriaceae bacterium]|nr:hypothetical protein [Flavobacteriaceae bacterium]